MYIYPTTTTEAVYMNPLMIFSPRAPKAAPPAGFTPTARPVSRFFSLKFIAQNRATPTDAPAEKTVQTKAAQPLQLPLEKASAHTQERREGLARAARRILLGIVVLSWLGGTIYAFVTPYLIPIAVPALTVGLFVLKEALFPQGPEGR